MTWLLAILLRSGAMLKSAVRWLFADWRRVAALTVAGIIIAQQLTIGRLRDQVVATERLMTQAARDHRDTISRITIAAADAAAADQANRARVESAWRHSLEEAGRENEVLRDRYRSAVAQFVRDQRSRSASGQGGVAAADLSSVAALPGEPMHDADVAVISVRDLELCADAYAQLAALILAWQSASAVDVNGSFNADARVDQAP